MYLLTKTDTLDSNPWERIDAIAAGASETLGYHQEFCRNNFSKQFEEFLNKYKVMKIVRGKQLGLEPFETEDLTRNDYRVCTSILSTTFMKPNEMDERLRFKKIILKSPSLKRDSATTKEKYIFPGFKFMKRPQLSLENEAEKIKHKNICDIVEKKS